MPSHISDHQYGQAVLNSVQSGTYPDSEEIIAAEVPPSALPTILKLVDQAREDVKVRWGGGDDSIVYLLLIH